MKPSDFHSCFSIGACLDFLNGRTNRPILERFFAAERFPFPHFAAVLVEACWTQGLTLDGAEWTRQQWPTVEDERRACGVLHEMFRGVFGTAVQAMRPIAAPDLPSKKVRRL